MAYVYSRDGISPSGVVVGLQARVTHTSMLRCDKAVCRTSSARGNQVHATSLTGACCTLQYF